MVISAIIVTRGDVDLSRILASLPHEWQIVVWNNGTGRVSWPTHEGAVGFTVEAPQAFAFGRYRAISYADGDVIYVQDDDCVVFDHEDLVDSYEPGVISAFMPESRTDYDDTVLVGWGALFDRDLPAQAFHRWRAAGEETKSEKFRTIGADFVFPMLTPHKRIDAEHEDLPWAHAENRTWKRPGYLAEKGAYLHRAREIRDRIRDRPTAR